MKIFFWERKSYLTSYHFWIKAIIPQ
ncbi:uncharacterized protein METZ01_LOCUS252842, partial [marine metagenome]